MNPAPASTPAQSRTVLRRRGLGWIHVVAGPEAGRYRRRLGLVGGRKAGLHSRVARLSARRAGAAASAASAPAAVLAIRMAQQAGERSDQVNRQREHDGGGRARAQLEQRLEVAQLDRGRVLADDLRGLVQALGRLSLALGVDDLRAPLA